MRVLQINAVNKTGSTGRTCAELDKYLKAHGHESFIAYGRGEKPTNSNEFLISSKLSYLSHNLLSKVFNNQGAYSLLRTKKLIEWIDEIKPDVIHLRNLFGNFLNFKVFFNYLKLNPNIKVVWTTHDFWLLNGNCSLILCDEYRNACKNCKHYKRNKYAWCFIRSHYNYERKKRLFDGLEKFGIQANSIFSKSVVDDSFLNNRKIKIIYNWIDLKSFYFEKDNSVFGLNNNKPVVLTIWAYLDPNSYRFKKLIEVAKRNCDKYNFVAVGNNKLNKGDYPYLKIINGTNNVNVLRKYYSSASVLFNPSNNDSFGKVVAEALSCGTPAVVFNKQALPELVGTDCGIVCQNDDAKTVSDAIDQVVSRGKDFYSDACINKANKLFNLDNNCEKLIEFYKEI